jgi:hypothetical protein
MTAICASVSECLTIIEPVSSSALLRLGHQRRGAAEAEFQRTEIDFSVFTIEWFMMALRRVGTAGGRFHSIETREMAMSAGWHERIIVIANESFPGLRT